MPRAPPAQTEIEHVLEHILLHLLCALRAVDRGLKVVFLKKSFSPGGVVSLERGRSVSHTAIPDAILFLLPREQPISDVLSACPFLPPRKFFLEPSPVRHWSPTDPVKLLWSRSPFTLLNSRVKISFSSDFPFLPQRLPALSFQDTTPSWSLVSI